MDEVGQRIGGDEAVEAEGDRGELAGAEQVVDGGAVELEALCRSKIRFSSVSCGDAVRSGSVTVFVYQTVEDRLSLDSMGLEVGNSGRDGRFGAVWR